MKKIVKLLVFTVMLKVWWQEPEHYCDTCLHQAIYMNAAIPDDNGSTKMFVLDLRTRELQWIDVKWITQKKLVDLKLKEIQ